MIRKERRQGVINQQKKKIIKSRGLTPLMKRTSVFSPTTIRINLSLAIKNIKGKKKERRVPDRVRRLPLFGIIGSKELLSKRDEIQPSTPFTLRPLILNPHSSLQTPSPKPSNPLRCQKDFTALLRMSEREGRSLDELSYRSQQKFINLPLLLNVPPRNEKRRIVSLYLRIPGGRRPEKEQKVFKTNVPGISTMNDLQHR